MAFATVELEKQATGELRKAPVGFSWTTLCFGFFPALIRSDWKWGLIQAAAALLTWGLSVLVFAFIYNRLYLNDLLDNGFQIKAINGADRLKIEQAIGRKLAETESSQRPAAS